MSNYTILYLGNSFTDMYLNELRGSILNMLDGTVSGKGNFPLAYAITNDKSALEQDFYFRHEGVKFLNYDTTQCASESTEELRTKDEVEKISKKLLEPDSDEKEYRESLIKKRCELELKLIELK